MFFRWLGQTVRRGWPFLLAGWVVLLLVTHLAAPPWAEYALDKEFAFLPANAPSRIAEGKYAEAFPEDQSRSTIALVLHRKDDEPGHLDRDRQFISDVLEPELRKIAESEGGLASEPVPDEGPLFDDEGKPPEQSKERSIIARIRTPNAPGSGALLVSPDERAMLVVLELTTELLTNRNWPTIAKVEQLLVELPQQSKIPPGDDLSITGSAVVGRDHTRAQRDSARATELLTIILVIALLVIIYRAPLLALIPLATVYLAVQLSLNVLAIMAREGYITLFRGIEIYITILAYGAGVDYCLFLTARYKEELDRFHPADAVARAVQGVGAALVASAATVICGIAMMMFAEFGKFRQAGFAIPLSLAFVLCATLTFSSSLLRLAGRWAFWPWHPRQAMGDGQPVAAKLGQDGQPARRGILERMWDDMGHALVRRPGRIWWITVALMAPFAIAAGFLNNHLSYDLIGDLPANAPSVAGTKALQEHFPAGTIGPATVLLVCPGEQGRSRDLATSSGRVDFGSDQGRSLMGKITDRLREQKDALELADVRSLTAPLGITPAAEQALAGPDVPDQARQDATKRLAL